MLLHTGTRPCSRSPSQHPGSKGCPVPLEGQMPLPSQQQPHLQVVDGQPPFQHSPKHTRWKSCKGLGGNKGLMNPQAALHLASY